MLGKLTDARYLKLSQEYEKEQAEISRLATALEQEVVSEAGQIADVGRFLELVDRYMEIQELDAALLNEMVSKIVVHSPERIDGKNTSPLRSTLPMWAKSASPSRLDGTP